MHSAPSSGPRGKNAPPSRGVFHAAMEDAPSDDEDSSASALTLKPTSKHVAPAHTAPTPPPQAVTKPSHASPASTKTQPHSANKKTTHASKVPVSTESVAIHSASELTPGTLAVTADATFPDDGATLASVTISSTIDTLPDEVIVESTPLQLESEPPAAPLASASSPSDDPPQAVSPRPTSQTYESVATVPMLKPVPSVKPMVTLKGLPSTPRATSFRADSSSMALPAKTQVPLQLAEPEALEVADTIRVDLQCFAVSRRQVESFCELEDVPLPPELALLQPSSELVSKIDSGEFCSPHLSRCSNFPQYCQWTSLLKSGEL
jgi:hypothetical protein